MPRHYFGGAPNAWAGGALFQQERRLRDHRENALNALIQRFGPEAGDPGALSQLETVDRQRQLLPHQIRGLERQEEIHPHRIRGFERQEELHPYAVAAQEHQARIRPLQLNQMQRSDEAFGALTDQHGPVAGDPTAQRIHTEQQELLRSAASNAARGIQHALRNDGDVLAAFDRAVQVLGHLGLPAEEIGRMREVIAESPEAAGELVEMLLGEETQSGRPLGQGQAFFNPETGEYEWRVFDSTGRAFNPVPGLVPAGPDQAQQRIRQRDRALTNEEARMRGFSATPGHQFYETPDGEIYARVVGGTAQDREVQAAERERDSAARSTIRVNQGVLAAGRTVQRDGRRALARLGADVQPEPGEDDLPREMRGLPRNVPLWRMLTSKVWGTQARRLERNIQSVMDNIGIDKLLEIKEAGSGLGHVPHQQMVMLQSVLGRLNDLDRPIPELLRDIQEVMWRYDEIMEAAQTEIREAEEELGRPRGPSSEPPPAQEGGAGAATPQEVPQQGAQAGGWQARARELQAQGLSQQEILDTLRREGLIR